MNIETPRPGPLGDEPPVPASDEWPHEEPAVRELPSAPVAPELPTTPEKKAGGQGDWKWFVAAAAVAAAFTAGAFAAANDAAEPAVEANAVPAAVTTPPTTTRAPIVPAPAPTVEPAPIDTTPLLLDASLVGDAVIPSVVTVEITGTVLGETGRIGSGSGVVFDDQGHIITNDHVVAAGGEYRVVLADGRVYPAELIGTDPTTDLAVLSIGARDLRPIALGSSDQLDVGDPAVAVGSPLGLEGTPSLTVGVISAFGREVQTDATTRLYGMLQTDAPITQGSSGGALVDGAGRLVGITTAVGVSEVGIEGIGFATPIEVVTRVVGELIANGEASDPFLGIFGSTSFADTVDGGSAPIGVAIESIEADTAAAAAGLNPGDVIAAVEGTSIKTMEELVSLLRRYGAGSPIELTLDDGSILPVTLGERPDA